MKRALLTATVQSHIAQFHRPLIRLLKEQGYEIHVAARDNLDEKNGLTIEHVDKKFNVPFARSPLSRNNLKAYFQIRKIIDEGDYDLISCNTPVGGIVTRLAAQKARKAGTRVIYTAHGFHFYQGAPKKNWLVFYPLEKEMSRLADTVITITKEDYRLARANFHSDVRHIHGVGADENKYRSVTPRQAQEFRNEQGFDDRFVILCTGELNENKNQATAIRAAALLKEKHPEVLLLLAGNGPSEQKLKDLIDELDLEDTVRLIGYRTDLEWYTNSCDLVISASFREGMPLNIMEAMICGKPVIASKNRGHRELVKDDVNGFLVNADDAEAFAQRAEMLMRDEQTRSRIVAEAAKRVQPYTMKCVEKELKSIYFPED